MNQFGHEGGNDTISSGRDIPWLQDNDTDQDGQSDVWLNTWAYTYRDIVIVGPQGQVLDIYNVTLNDLAEGENFNDLKQLFVDAADTLVADGEDSFQTRPNETVELNVLVNDGSNVTLESVTQPANGTTEVATVEYQSDLSPDITEPVDFLISEVQPGQFLEVFNVGYEPLDLSNSTATLAIGGTTLDMATLGNGVTVPARGYAQLPISGGLPISEESGEVLVYDGSTPINDTALIADFLAWGDPVQGGFMELAKQAGEWIGDPADSLPNGGSIQRLPSFDGMNSASYGTDLTPTPGEAIAGTESQQIVRYMPATDFIGDDTFSYMIRAQDNSTREITVNISVMTDAAVWQNPVNRLDINNDGHIVPLDALLVINALNNGLRGTLPATIQAPVFNPPFVDCNGNGSIESLDALLVINHLNNPANGEGEGASNASISQSLVAAPPTSAIVSGLPVPKHVAAESPTTRVPAPGEVALNLPSATTPTTSLVAPSSSPLSGTRGDSIETAFAESESGAEWWRL